MIDNKKKQQASIKYTIVTAGSTYLDIDAYACMVAVAELLNLKGGKAIAYSLAPKNYSVAQSLTSEEDISDYLPPEFENAGYIIVDVSDTDFLKDSVPLERVEEIYDHHVGFEEYWESRLGNNSHIEFIGAAATLVYREWKKAGLTDKMRPSTAKLLSAAILDNTLYLTSSNTTEEDVKAFTELSSFAGIDEDWCAAYFSLVQENVEADLKNALFSDIKTVRNNRILPSRISQLCVWDAERITDRLDEIVRWFSQSDESWMINIIDIRHRCSYFVCFDVDIQKKLSEVFGVRFIAGIACTPKAYLRKEIIKKTL